jgi:hypothetical protein
MNYLVVFGGYLAKKEWVSSWANNLAKLKEYTTEWKVIPYEGPNDSLYRNLEIKVSSLAKEINESTDLGVIEIVCHSSGAYPAYELISYINNAKLQYIKLVILDSDYGHGKTKINLTRFINLKSITGVCAFHIKDGRTVNSSNTFGILQLEKLLGKKIKVIKHDASNAGCNINAIWSLHDAMIVKKVANPASYDLKNDYGTDITNLEHYWL